MATAAKGKKSARTTKAGSGKQSAADRRKLFVEAYIANGGNATKAALSAGFSAKTAGSQGHDLLKHPEIVLKLQERRQSLASSYELTSEAVIKSLAQAVYFDPRKLYDEHGNLKPIQDLDDDTAAAISGLEVSEIRNDGVVIGHTKKVKWLDKNTARDQAMKHLGLFGEDNKQRNPLEGISRDSLKDVLAHLAKLRGKP